MKTSYFDGTTLVLSRLTTAEQELQLQRMLVSMYSRRVEILEPPEKVFSQIQDILNASELDIEKLAGLVAVDARISRKVTQLATSVAFTSMIPPSSLKSAILRIGISEVRKIFNTEMSRKIYAGTSIQFRAQVRRLWEHSLRCAEVAEYLVEIYDGFTVTPAAAYTAGLLHDIGKLHAISCLNQLHQRQEISELPDQELIFKVIGILHQERGADLLHLWKFDVTYSQALRNFKDFSVGSVPSRYEGNNQLAEIITISNELVEITMSDLEQDDMTTELHAKLSILRRNSRLGLTIENLNDLEAFVLPRSAT